MMLLGSKRKQSEQTRDGNDQDSKSNASVSSGATSIPGIGSGAGSGLLVKRARLGKHAHSSALVLSGTGGRELISTRSNDKDDEENGQVALANQPKRVSDLKAPTMLLTGHEGHVNSVKFNPSGSAIVSAGQDKLLLLWSVYGDCNNYAVLRGHKSVVLDLDWLQGGRRIVSCGADRKVLLWDGETGKKLKRMRGHQSFVNSVCGARHGDTLVATGSDDRVSFLWDVRARRPSQSLQHRVAVLDVAFSDDSKQLFTAGLDNAIHVWDLRKSNKVMHHLRGHADTVTGLAVSPDGSFLLSNSMDNTLRMWDIRAFVPDENNRLVKLFVGSTHDFQKQMLRCSWSSNGKRISAGSADQFVHVWDVDTSSVLYQLPGHAGCVNAVEFHPKQPILASCGHDGKIFLGEMAY